MNLFIVRQMYSNYDEFRDHRIFQTTSMDKAYDCVFTAWDELDKDWETQYVQYYIEWFYIDADGNIKVSTKEFYPYPKKLNQYRIDWELRNTEWKLQADE